jgi:hypothetical protein
MLPFGVTFPAPVPQRSEIPEGVTSYPACCINFKIIVILGWLLESILTFKKIFQYPTEISENVFSVCSSSNSGTFAAN